VYAWGEPKPIQQIEVGVFTRSLVFHPDEPERLIAGSNDGMVRSWDVPGGTLSDTLQAHKRAINRLAIHPDGNTLASAADEPLIYLWDFSGGEKLGELIGGAFVVPDLVFTADGAWLVSLDGGVIRVRETESGRLVHSLRSGDSAHRLALRPGFLQVAVASSGGALQLWDLQAGELLWEVLDEHGDDAWALVFSADGSLLFSGWRSGKLCWLPVDGRVENTCLPAHDRPLGVLSLLEGGRVLFSAGYDGMGYFWQAAP
jgi:WD40 repeat protein